MAGGIRYNNRDVQFAGDTDKDDKTSKLCPYCNGRLMPVSQYDYMACISCGRTGIPKDEPRIESDISDIVERDANDDGFAISIDDPRLSKRRREIIERSMDWRPDQDG